VTYLDSSCLLSLLCKEPGSDAVRSAVNDRAEVLISSLAELETEIQLMASFRGGEIRLGQLRHYQAQLVAMRNADPFHFRSLPGEIFAVALKQLRHPQSIYCRTLDRLHLAAMEQLKADRLLTLDEHQADVARGLAFAVTVPVSR
jgi:predicted nucleic acid-binding protein